MNNNLTILTALEKIVKDNTDFKAVKSGYGKEFADWYSVGNIPKESMFITMNNIVPNITYENNNMVLSSTVNIYISTKQNFEEIVFNLAQLFNEKIIETSYNKSFEIIFDGAGFNYSFDFELIEFNIIIKER